VADNPLLHGNEFVVWRAGLPGRTDIVRAGAPGQGLRGSSLAHDERDLIGNDRLLEIAHYDEEE